MAWTDDEVISPKSSFWQSDEEIKKQPSMGSVLWNSAKQVIPDLGNFALDISKAAANADAAQYGVDAKAAGLPMPENIPLGSREATDYSDKIGFTNPEYAPQTPGQKIAAGMVKGALNAAALNPTSSIPGLVGNAASGGLSSLAYDITEKATDSGVAGLAAGIAAPILAGKAISPEVSQKAKLLFKEGINPTIGQILGGAVNRTEEKLTSNAIAGDLIRGARDRTQEDLNRAVYNRALKPVGSDANQLPVGREGVLSVKEALTKEYDALLPKLSFKADNQFIDEITNLSSMSKNMMPKEATAFQSKLDDYLSRLSPSGGMTGEQYKQLYSSIGKDIKGFVKSPDPYHQQLGDSLKEAQRVFKSALERSNPNYADDLAAIDKGFSNYAVLRDAGSASTDMSMGFTPSQLARAVRANDNTVSKGATASGSAKMQDLSDAAVEVLGQKTPNSYTADRRSVADLAKYLLYGGTAVGGGIYAPQVAIPAAVTAGVAALPYTSVGQKAIAKMLLSERPEMIETFADSLRKGKIASFLTGVEK